MLPAPYAPLLLMMNQPTSTSYAELPTLQPTPSIPRPSAPPPSSLFYQPIQSLLTCVVLSSTSRIVCKEVAVLWQFNLNIVRGGGGTNLPVIA